MGAVLAARMVELAGRVAGFTFRHLAFKHPERTGHAQMHQEHVAGGEIRHQIFGATAEAGDDLAFQPRDKVFLKRKPQILAPGFGFQDFRPLHGGLQAAADGLNFGQFRHAGIHLMKVT